MRAVLLRAGLGVYLVSLVACGGGSEPPVTSTTIAPAMGGSAPKAPPVAVEDDAEYELDVIAACVIGGASLSGGRGSVAEALLGALLIGVLRNGCNLLDISAFWQRAVMGLIILLAGFYDRNVRR